MLRGIPRILFSVNKYINMFYHLCVLFSEYFPDEISLGILKNSDYQQEHEHLKTERLHRLFQDLQEYSFYTWDFMGLPLFNASDGSIVKKTLINTSRKIAETWSEIYQEAEKSYEPIWTQTEPKLKSYATKFKSEWIPVSETIMTKMSNIASLPWKQNSVNVHFVDCIRGASAWTKDVTLAPYTNVDVEKKLLTHELAHTLIPEYFLRTKLQRFGLDHSISHTIVDLIAYFSIRDHVAEPEKPGIKPKPEYYPQCEKLYPIFEDRYSSQDKFQSFDELLEQIKSESLH